MEPATKTAATKAVKANILNNGLEDCREISKFSFTNKRNRVLKSQVVFKGKEFLAIAD